MIKKTYLLILVMLFAAPGLMAQTPTVTVGDKLAGAGEILVPVYMEDFEDVVTIELWLKIDTLVLELEGIENLAPELEDGSFLYNQVDDRLLISWFSLEEKDLDGKILDLRLTYSGGFETTISFIEDRCEIGKAPMADLIEPVNYVAGTVGQDPDLIDGHVSMTTVEAKPGQEVTMPITLKGEGFESVGSFEFFIEVDPDQIDFGQVVAQSGLTGLMGAEVADGLIKVVWSPLVADEDFSDETHVADIVFKYLGGGPAQLKFTGESTVLTAFGGFLSVHYNDGMVVMEDTDARMSIADKVYQRVFVEDDLEDAPVYEVPVTVDKITQDVYAISISIGFDGNQVEFEDVDFAQLEGWNVAATESSIDLTWSDMDGATLDDGELFVLHFSLPEDAEEGTSDLVFRGGTNLLDQNANIMPVALDNGSITITDIPYYTVTFNVVDEDDEPITDAVVTLNGVANDAGDYVFEDVMEGTYDYTVEKDGFVTAEGDVVVDDDITVDVTLMEVTYTVTFVVEDEEGDPIEDAVVTLNGVTNEAGEYVFEDVKAGTYDYTVVKAGYETVEDDVEVEDDTTVTVTLVEVEIPVFTVTFVVEDEDGAAITDAVVTLGDVTNDAGDYVFEDLEAGDYTYTVTADGYHDATGTVEVDDADVTETVVLSLVTYTVTFDVVDGDGAAITNAVITLNGDTNDEGDYEFTDLVPGNYDYEVTAAGYFDATGDVAVTDADVDVTVVLAVDDTNIPETGLSVLTLFPNPASATLNIVSEGSVITEVRAIDMLGQVVYSTSVQDHRHEINVSGYRNGVYFIQVTTAEGIQTHRIQVAR